jgi:hypothetical protein
LALELEREERADGRREQREDLAETDSEPLL